MQTSSFRTRDGLQLFYRSWYPEDDVRAVVILSHGYAEHSGRYQELAEVLTEQGYAVHALDHRGHGQSEGERANVRVFRLYVDDLGRFSDLLREQDPRPPRFLLGHSMGGLIALQLVLEHPEKVDGVVLSAVLVRSAVKVSPLIERAAGLISALSPKLPVQHLDTDALARDRRVVERYRNDPLVYHGKIKARLGAEMLHAGPYALLRAPSIRLPLLLLHGTADRLADVLGSQELLARLGGSDKTLELYDGAFHEIFNDFGKAQVQRDLVAWLGRRVGNEQ